MSEQDLSSALPDKMAERLSVDEHGVLLTALCILAHLCRRTGVLQQAWRIGDTVEIIVRRRESYDLVSLGDHRRSKARQRFEETLQRALSSERQGPPMK